MKKAYKAVWVNEHGERLSVLAARCDFFKETDPMIKRPVRYLTGEWTVAATDMRPYLFVYDTLPHAVASTVLEYWGTVKGGKILPDPATLIRGESGEPVKGFVEVWECEYESYLMPKVDMSRPNALTPIDFFDGYVQERAPTGTQYASKIKLVRLVPNLRPYHFTK